MSDAPILPDILAPDLKLVFCGTAASRVSARASAYYANPSNYFWRTLHAVGLTPDPLDPQQFRQVLTYGIGLTDLAKKAQGNDSDLTQSDFDRAALHQKIERFQPRMIAFTSKKAASVYFEVNTRQLDYGLQTRKQGVTRFWVLTSPSGAARSYWDQSVWQALADHVGKVSQT